MHTRKTSPILLKSSVRCRLDNLASDLGLGPHRINGDNTTSQSSLSQKNRNSRDLIRLLFGGQLSQHQAVFHRPSADHVERFFACRMIMRASKRLPIDRDHPLNRFADPLHPLEKTRFKLLGINARKNLPHSLERHLYALRTGESSSHMPASITPSTPIRIVSRSPIIPPSMPASSAPSGATPCDKNCILAFVRPSRLAGTSDCRRLTSAMK